MRSFSPNTQHGAVTLTELLVTLTVIALCARLAAPWFGTLAHHVLVRTAVQDLHRAIIHARLAAIQCRCRVDLAATGNDWSNGWQMTDAEGTVLLRHAPLPMAVHSISRLSDGFAHISFTRSGRSQSGLGDGVPQFGQIRLFAGTRLTKGNQPANEAEQIVVINFLGRVRVCNLLHDARCAPDLPD